MKFFIDTADVGEIREAQNMGLLDGVTTNPSLIAKTGRKFEEVITEICEIVDGPISAEVVGTDAETIIEEAKVLSALHPNIVVKIPLITEGLKAVAWCADNGIKTNVTLCFSPVQALLAAKAGATYISPFVGRLDDISTEGMDLSGFALPREMASSVRRVKEAALAVRPQAWPRRDRCHAQLRRSATGRVHLTTTSWLHAAH